MKNNYQDYEYANIVKLTNEDYLLNGDPRFNIRCTHFSYAVGKTKICKDGAIVFEDLLTQDEKTYPLFKTISQAQFYLSAGQLGIDEAFAINVNPVTEIISREAFKTKEELIERLEETGLEFTFMRAFENAAPVLIKRK